MSFVCVMKVKECQPFDVSLLGSELPTCRLSLSTPACHDGKVLCVDFFFLFTLSSPCISSLVRDCETLSATGPKTSSMAVVGVSFVVLLYSSLE